jgi:hypothetical protein
MMEINYQETTKDLLTRIDIHQKYGGRDIDQWMIELLQPAKGSKIWMWLAARASSVFFIIPIPAERQILRAVT